MFVSEKSVISELFCYQLSRGGGQVICTWQAKPPAPFYEVVVFQAEGSGISNSTVSVNHSTLKLNTQVGSEIVVSVNNASIKVQLIGMSKTIS